LSLRIILLGSQLLVKVIDVALSYKRALVHGVDSATTDTVKSIAGIHVAFITHRRRPRLPLRLFSDSGRYG